jgi:hypothetical protein
MADEDAENPKNTIGATTVKGSSNTTPNPLAQSVSTRADRQLRDRLRETMQDTKAARKVK